MAGSAFKYIAEHVHAMKTNIDAETLKEDLPEAQHLPRFKKGLYDPVERVTSELDIKLAGEAAEWIAAGASDDNKLSIKPIRHNLKQIPDLTGWVLKTPYTSSSPRDYG